jgi:hypothetical protein
MTIRTLAEKKQTGSAADAQAVDPRHLAAEIEVRLTHQGHSPGPGYRRATAVNAVRQLLAAMDIPATRDPLAESRRVAARVAALAGGAR